MKAKSGITREELSEGFKACNVYAKPECRGCFAKLYCSGGCMANAFHHSGSVTGIHEEQCVLQRKRVECALYLKAMEALESSEEEKEL